LAVGVGTHVSGGNHRNPRRLRLNWWGRRDSMSCRIPGVSSNRSHDCVNHSGWRHGRQRRHNHASGLELSSRYFDRTWSPVFRHQFNRSLRGFLWFPETWVPTPTAIRSFAKACLTAGARATARPISAFDSLRMPFNLGSEPSPPQVRVRLSLLTAVSLTLGITP